MATTPTAPSSHPLIRLFSFERELAEVLSAFYVSHKVKSKSVLKSIAAQKTEDQSHNNYPPFNRSMTVSEFELLIERYDKNLDASYTALPTECHAENKVSRDAMKWLSLLFRSDTPRDRTGCPTSEDWEQLKDQVKDLANTFLSSPTCPLYISKKDWDPELKKIQDTAAGHYYYYDEHVQTTITRIGLMSIILGQGELFYQCAKATTEKYSDKSPELYLNLSLACPPEHPFCSSNALDALSMDAQAIFTSSNREKKTKASKKEVYRTVFGSYQESHPLTLLMALNLGIDLPALSKDDTKPNEEHVFSKRMRSFVSYGDVCEHFINQNSRSSLEFLDELIDTFELKKHLLINEKFGDFSFYPPKKPDSLLLWQDYIQTHLSDITTTKFGRRGGAFEELLLSGQIDLAFKIYQHNPEQMPELFEHITSTYSQPHPLNWVAAGLAQHDTEECKKYFDFFTQTGLFQQALREPALARQIAISLATNPYTPWLSQTLSTATDTLDCVDPFLAQVNKARRKSEQSWPVTVSGTCLLMGWSPTEHLQTFKSPPVASEFWATYGYTSTQDPEPECLFSLIIQRTEMKRIHSISQGTARHYLAPKDRAQFDLYETHQRNSEQQLLEFWQIAKTHPNPSAECYSDILIQATTSGMPTLFTHVIESLHEAPEIVQKISLEQLSARILKEILSVSQTTPSQQKNVSLILDAMERFNLPLNPTVSQFGTSTDFIHVLIPSILEDRWDTKEMLSPIQGPADLLLRELSTRGIDIYKKGNTEELDDYLVFKPDGGVEITQPGAKVGQRIAFYHSLYESNLIERATHRTQFTTHKKPNSI